MSLVIRELERLERRIVGAFRCVDATTRVTVDVPLQVEVADARIQRNRSGIFVILAADALPAFTDSFPTQPAAGAVSLTATIRDPSGRYLPRVASLALPRDPSPLHAANGDSLFRPIEVEMHPAGVAPLGVNWSVLRVNVTADGSGDALGGALLRVLGGGKVLARGMTDWRGEALVPVPGVPVTTWSDDENVVVITEIAAQLELVFDPAAGVRTTAANVLAARAPAVMPLVNPDVLEANRAALPNAAQSVQLAAGRSQSISFLLALP
ncbi:hypothetical protein VVD49_06335 [Uliginosibacterium sp. H3]|uniref:Uncharacterized protein n=1 Tax=Uliginosibacterium silvisoli TaxID=3114758 RepID=A0ABU6K2N3_9RHOO|nr:hypothetical protein [Uliginosibacterium sp. H3]